MKVLLSIKPEFVEKIFNGTKKYEYRKSLFKNNDVKTIVVYASAPMKCVVGEFKIDDILSDDVKTVWEQTKKYSGITKEFYQSYFKQKKIANAIKIGSVKKFKSPKTLFDYNISQAPQSFCYILD